MCHPGNGSLVDWQEGDVNCKIIKLVIDPSISFSSAPSEFSPNRAYGPLFYLSTPWGSISYYFDGFTGNHWPTHDPSGSDRPNQKKNVVHPHGNIVR